jgi:ribonuclease HI
MHLRLLKHIVSTITDSAYTVHLWKVKSHVGIVGNEKADETAVAVSKGLGSQEHADFEEYKHPSNNRDDMYWLYTEPEVEPNKTAEALAAHAARNGDTDTQPINIALIPEPN